MSTLRFSAHCRRERQVAPGHVVRCDETFTDPAAFEAHMMGEHGAKKRQPGGAYGSNTDTGRWNTEDKAAPGWSGGKPLAPHPHTAPRPERGGLEKVAERIAAGEYVWPGVRGWGLAGQPAAETETEERAA